MNFALSTKYSEIDFEYVSLTDLLLIGGGCGDGGGGSTTVTTASLQAAAQSAAAAPGANTSVGISIGDPVPSYDLVISWRSSTAGGGTENGTAWVNTSTGSVSSVVSHSGNSGGFWASVGGFFSWLFGSH
jgi:hypothetical protein